MKKPKTKLRFPKEKFDVKKLTPNEWALIFSAPYREKARVKGVKLCSRHLERLKEGFCKDWVLGHFKGGAISGLSSIFWWVYSDAVIANIY